MTPIEEIPYFSGLGGVVALSLPIGPVEAFPDEGTREVYIGVSGQAARILLMAPLGPEGPYARALNKRGPGLHHIAFHVPSITAFINQHKGWFLMPESLETYKTTRTIWLARPGLGTLIEVHETKASYQHPALVQQIEVVAPELDQSQRLLAGISGATKITGTQTDPSITIADQSIAIRQLLGA